jgi:hypothetical protein
MRGIFAAIWIISIAVLAITVVPSYARAEDQKSLEAELRQAYEHKLLSLRTPYFGKTLSFDSNGVPIQQAAAGPWSTCGLLQVQKLRITQDGVEIDGKRAILALRSEGGTGQGATSVRLQVVPILIREAVRIRIQTSTVNVEQINNSLSHVFQGGRLVDRVAAYWKPMTNDLKAFRLRTPNGIIGELEGQRPVYLINHGVVEPPRQFMIQTQITQKKRGTRGWRVRLYCLSLLMNKAFQKYWKLRAV